MPEDSIRIELAFDGGQIIAALVTPETADAVEAAVSGAVGGTLELETSDGRVTISVARIVYLKRYRRGAQPGFLSG